jgi:LacI family transcriptional regulator
MNSEAPQSERSGPATMTDVARAAGVSIKSVSRVINREPHVTPKLRAKIEAAIAALNYVPETAARSLAGARSFTISVLFDNPSPNYTMMVVAGVYRACTENQYHLRIDTINSAVEPDALKQQLDQILRHSRSDGLVLTPPLTDNPAVLDFLNTHGIRYCRIAPIFDRETSLEVWIDDAAAAADVADHFWNLGHRRFGLVGGPFNHGAARTRREGYIGRLHQLDPSIIVSEADGGFDFEQGIAAGRELLAARRYPTAIFAANDDSAAGVMAACRELALDVPGDVSIIGFDDSWVAKSVWPYLTTIHQPISEMAHAATCMLLDRSIGAGDTKTQQLDYRLIARASAGSPR